MFQSVGYIQRATTFDYFILFDKTFYLMSSLITEHGNVYNSKFHQFFHTEKKLTTRFKVLAII